MILLYLQEEQDRLEERLRAKIEILRNNDEIVIEVSNRNAQIFVVTLHLINLPCVLLLTAKNEVAA